MSIGHLTAEISRLYAKEMGVRGNAKENQVRPEGRQKRSVPRGGPPGIHPDKDRR